MFSLCYWFVNNDYNVLIIIMFVIRESWSHFITTGRKPQRPPGPELIDSNAGSRPLAKQKLDLQRLLSTLHLETIQVSFTFWFYCAGEKFAYINHRDKFSRQIWLLFVFYFWYYLTTSFFKYLLLIFSKPHSQSIHKGTSKKKWPC